MMKKILTVIVGVVFFQMNMTAAQEVESDEKVFDMTVTLNSDIFFGFYPFFAGSYTLGDKTDFTFYGILWSGGTGSSWGNWTEFGFGLSFNPTDALSINPQIGILSGNLTSGLGTPVLGEGLVPNLTIGLDTDKAEGEIYAGYYIGFNHGNPNTNTYLHYWINGGYKVSKFFSAGLHMEHLRFMGGQNLEGDVAYDYYVAIGPYVQFADPKGGAFARFTAAGDLRSEEEVIASAYNPSSFFKLTVGYGF